jgi:RNA polymerase sigma-70 factor (ECF subfamily)
VSLEQLINDCKKGDIKAQEQLYRLYSGKLFSVCLKYSRNYAEAEDNLQDGFLIIFDKITQFKFAGSFEGWIKRIMVNNVLQQYRKTGFLELIHENIKEEESVDVELDDDNLSMDYLLQIIQELPDRYRLVFNLYVMDDYSHKEIAEMMGITTGTSKSNLARGRMILKEKIEIYNRLNKIPTAR